MSRFTGATVLVTGGTSGMGRATAERIAAEGGAVVIAGRRKDLGDEVVETITARGGEAFFVETDVTDEGQVARLVEQAVARYGRLDAAFNNAGGGSTFGPVQDLDARGWAADVELNLTSAFFCLKHEVPALLASGGGAILNNASNLGVVGMPTASPYVAAKHGLVGLTRSVALELATSNVRVNALVTGGVDTPLFRGSMGASPEGAAHIASLHPMNRVAQPEEIAAFAAFLLSPESSFVTGAALAVDGGWTAQ